MKASKEVLTDQEFDSFLSTHVDFVKSYLGEERVEMYIPEIVILEIDGSIHIIRLILDEDRYETVREVGRECHRKQIKPMAVLMTFEAWMRENPRNHPISSRPISSYEDKKEVISIMGITFDGRRNGAMLWFERRKKDNSISIRKDKIKIISCNETNGDKVRGDLLPEFFKGYAEEFLSQRN